MYLLLLISKSIPMGSENVVYEIPICVYDFNFCSFFWGVVSKSVVSYSWWLTCWVISDYEFS